MSIREDGRVLDETTVGKPGVRGRHRDVDSQLLEEVAVLRVLPLRPRHVDGRIVVLAKTRVIGLGHLAQQRDLVGLADPLLMVPSTVTARIQEMHIMLGQMLCGALEIELGLAEDPHS